MGYIGEKARGDPSKEKELRAFVGDPDEFEQEPRVAPWFRFNLRGLVFIIAEENRRGRVDGPTININLYSPTLVIGHIVKNGLATMGSPIVKVAFRSFE